MIQRENSLLQILVIFKRRYFKPKFFAFQIVIMSIVNFRCVMAC